MLMPTLVDLRSLESLIAVLGWCCVIHGMAWLVFQSSPMRSIAERRAVADAPRQHRLRILKGEIAAGRELLAQETLLRKGSVLTTAEVESRAVEIAGLERMPILKRLWFDLLGCPACQHGWIGIACAVVDGHRLISVPDGVGYAIVTVALFSWLEARSRNRGGA